MTNHVHLIICTHTSRYLDAVLRGAATQTEKPATVSVNVDGDDPQIVDLCRARAAIDGYEILVTLRRPHGIMRLAQSRNNAVRRLWSAGHRDGLLLFIDGDIVLGPDAIERHASFFAPGAITIGNRVNLTPEQTARVLETGCVPDDEEIRDDLLRLERLHDATNVQQWLRRAGLTKAHKPRALGAQLATDFGLFCLVNGFDETYQGYGCEDDDFVRRVYRASGRATNAIRDIRTYHLFHPTRAGAKWRDNPGARHFLQRNWRATCTRGFWTPVEQHAVRRILARGADVEAGIEVVGEAVARFGESTARTES